MVAWEQRNLRSVEAVIRQEYVAKGRTMPELAAEMGIDVSTLSRWMSRLGIPARIFASDRPDTAA